MQLEQLRFWFFVAFSHMSYLEGLCHFPSLIALYTSGKSYLLLLLKFNRNGFQTEVIEVKRHFPLNFRTTSCCRTTIGMVVALIIL